MKLWKKRKKKVPKIPVTEFTITYFDLTGLELDNLLDLYTNHAYRFAQRQGLETPGLGATTYPSIEKWEES